MMSRFVLLALCLAAAHGFTLGARFFTVNVGTSGSPAPTANAITMTNLGANAVDISGWFICYSGTSSCTALSCTTTNLVAFGGSTPCNAPTTLSSTSGSLALRETASGTIKSFVQWGAGNLYLSGDAVSAGEWDSAANFVAGNGVLTNVGAAQGTVSWVAASAILGGVSLTGNFTTTTSSSSTVVSGSFVVTGEYTVTGTGTTVTVTGSASVGSLTLNGGASINLATSSNFAVTGNANLAGQYSLSFSSSNSGIIAVAGTATVSGTLQVSIAAGFTFNAGQTLTVLSYASLSGSGYTSVSFVKSGTRAGTANGASVSCGATSCVITGRAEASPSPGAGRQAFGTAERRTGDGLSQSDRIGIGVGVGLGVPIMIAMLVLIALACRAGLSPLTANVSVVPSTTQRTVVSSSSSSADYSTESYP